MSRHRPTVFGQPMFWILFVTALVLVWVLVG